MRKFTAIFLALVMMCSLFGCTQGSQEQDNKPRYSVTDLMVNMSVEITKQIGMQADRDFLTAMDFPADLVAAASIFEEAVDAEHVTAKVLPAVLKTMPSDITRLCSQFGGSTQVACCGALTESVQIHLARKLEHPTAIYLRYSESCHFIVVFTPLGDNLASVWAYPLFADVAEEILDIYFSEAENLDADQVKAACKRSANIHYEAQCTDYKVDADYYIQLATTAIKDMKPLKKNDISKYTSNEQIIANVMQLSRQMCSSARSVRVYRYPDDLQSQVDDLLCDTKYSQQLQAYARRQLCLNYPRLLSNTYGENWIVSNAILATALQPANLGATAKETEAPVLILMDLGGNICLLMSIYPSEYNIYQYGYTLLPVSYKEAHAMLMRDGAVRMN